MTDQKEQVEQTFGMLRVYTKDVSYTFSPENLPSQDETPEVKISVNTDGGDLGDDLSEVNVFTDVRIANPAGDNFVSFSIVYTGLFVSKNLGDAKEYALFFDGGNAIWVYISKMLDRFLVNSGLPPLTLGATDYRELLKETLRANQQEK